MAIATRLGPWILGTVRATTGTTAGLIRNMGVTAVIQTGSYTAPSGISTSAAYTGTATTIAVIPAGSVIHAIIADTTTAFTGASGATTLTFQTGNATTGLSTNLAAASALASISATPTISIGRATATASTTAANLAVFNNVGTTDLIIQVVFATTGNYTSGGTANFQVVYGVRNPDGTYYPTSYTGPS
jgi:hypothetical protein